MSTPSPAAEDQASAVATYAGIPVLLLIGHPGIPTISAAVGTGQPCRYTSTTVVYEDGLRAEVHAPGGPTPEELVLRMLPGAAKLWPALLATPGEMIWGTETSYGGLTARAGIWNGWTLCHLTRDEYGRGRLPALRLVGVESLPTGRPGRDAASGL
ncbi:hypothetical protein [Streptomyces sp. FH025]|uniref:hypothetical protein n=1 Tax=Streptomyces sp. FH025 TaxID=2815937 RepID=UPI001A9CE4E0|nr:hypothetical protein [Streptomyces sp. FH025]MBO1413230.1 hypothetical protein [Streptomyces sp. FH025]